MFDTLENFFMNNIAGKVIAVLVSAITTYLASGKIGASVSVDPAALTSVLTSVLSVIIVIIHHYRAPAAADNAAK